MSANRTGEDPALRRSSRTDDDERARWRERQLLRSGFEPACAAVLAAEDGVDLHALIELVERGCPPQLAVRILAPLDGGGPSC